MTIDLTNHPIFICGHPKAGTSLITALLDGHPALLTYPEETLFFRRYLPAIQGQSEAERLRLAEELLIHIFEWNQTDPPDHQKDFPDRDYSDIDFDAVKRTLRAEVESRGTEPKAYLEAAIFAFGMVSRLLTEESRWWVEKTPYNEFYADKIFDWWPVAKCIHIVRDLRDNFVSYQRKQPDWTAKVFAWNWVRSVQAGLANQEKFGSERYLIIRFEDLLRDPDAITHHIADFLDLPWHEALLRPTRAGDSWRGNSMFDNRYRAISTDPIGRWKTYLNQYDLGILQAIARRMMAAMSYNLVQVPKSDLSPLQKASIFREQIVARLKGA